MKKGLIMEEKVRVLFTVKTLENFEAGKVVKGSLSSDKDGKLIFRAFNIAGDDNQQGKPYYTVVSAHSSARVYKDKVTYRFHHMREKGKEVKLLQGFAIESSNALDFIRLRLAEDHVRESEERREKSEESEGGKSLSTKEEEV